MDRPVLAGFCQRTLSIDLPFARTETALRRGTIFSVAASLVSVAEGRKGLGDPQVVCREGDVFHSPCIMVRRCDRSMLFDIDQRDIRATNSVP